MRDLLEDLNTASDRLTEGLSLGRVRPISTERSSTGLSPLLRGPVQAPPAPQTRVETVLVAGTPLEESPETMKLTADEAAHMIALAMFMVKMEKTPITFANLTAKLTEMMPDYSRGALRAIARLSADYYAEMVSNEGEDPRNATMGRAGSV